MSQNKYELVQYTRHSHILISILKNNIGIGSFEFSDSSENEEEKENSRKLIKLLEDMINGWNAIEKGRSN